MESWLDEFGVHIRTQDQGDRSWQVEPFIGQREIDPVSRWLCAAEGRALCKLEDLAGGEAERSKGFGVF